MKYCTTGSQMGSKKIGVLIGGSGLIGGTIVNYYKPNTRKLRHPSAEQQKTLYPGRK